MNPLGAYFHQKFGLSYAMSEDMASFFQEREMDKNRLFVTQGKLETACAILMHGIVRYYALDEEGNGPTCYFSTPHHILMDPFTYRKNLSATLNIETVTHVRLAVLTLEGEKELTKAFPGWPGLCTELLLEVSMEFGNQKTMTSMKAGDRYAYFREHYPVLSREVPLQYIASYLGITQQSLSRLRKAKS